MFRLIDPDDIVVAGLYELYELQKAYQGDVLQGTPVSRGSGAGTARTAGRPADAAHFRPGDVLIVASATPDWAGLISGAAAVISETGGELSNLAIAAREQGVPAVFGLRGATGIIPEGARVEVNGTTGTVRWQ